MTQNVLCAISPSRTLATRIAHYLDALRSVRRPLLFEYIRNAHRKIPGRLLCFLVCIAISSCRNGLRSYFAFFFVPRSSLGAYVLYDCPEMHMLPAHTNAWPNARSLEARRIALLLLGGRSVVVRQLGFHSTRRSNTTVRGIRISSCNIRNINNHITRSRK